MAHMVNLGIDQSDWSDQSAKFLLLAESLVLFIKIPDATRPLTSIWLEYN